MSIGGPTPGTLLIQRLDAVLGINLSQQANVVSGVRPDAVSQPGNPNRADPAQNETLRHPQDAANRVTAQAEKHGRPVAGKAQSAAIKGEVPAARSTTSTSTTPSAPTTLGQAARAILNLLALYPDTIAAITGKAPLVNSIPAGSPAIAASQNPIPPGQPGAANVTGAGGAGGAGGAASAAAGTGAAGPASPAPAASVPASAAAGVDTASSGATAPAPATFAGALAESLQTSGLFYESHLNNLAFGKQSASSLQLEPQAQLSSAADTARPGAAGLHPETHLLVRQQLEVLANQVFAWQGEAWPNAPMRWEIKRHDDTASGDEDPRIAKWSTRIALELPSLGSVEARLHLTGQTLMLHLAAPSAAALLHENAQALRTRCEAYGLHVSHLSIDTNHQKGDAMAADTPLHEA